MEINYEVEHTSERANTHKITILKLLHLKTFLRQNVPPRNVLRATSPYANKFHGERFLERSFLMAKCPYGAKFSQQKFYHKMFRDEISYSKNSVHVRQACQRCSNCMLIISVRNATLVTMGTCETYKSIIFFSRALSVRWRLGV